MHWIIKLIWIPLVFLLRFQDTIEKPKIELKSDKVSVKSGEEVLELTVQIVNTMECRISVLDFPDFSSENKSIYKLEFLKDSTLMILPKNLFEKRRRPTRQDYVHLKPGEKLELKFKLNMVELVRDYEFIGDKNKNYGIYKIRVIYHDDYKLYRSAINSLESKMIDVEFIK